MARLIDIAKKAGVSISAVSRVLNQDDSFSIALKTKQKILQIAHEMQYPVNPNPRKADSEETLYKLGLIMLYSETDEIKDPYYLTIRTNVKTEATRLKFSTVEYFCTDPDIHLPDFSECSALIIIGEGNSWTSRLEESVQKAGKPVVFVDFIPEYPNSDLILTDFEEMMKKAMNHLVALKFTRIAYIGGREFNPKNKKPIIDLREKYFQQILESNGIYDSKYVYIDSDVTFENGYSLCEKMIKAGDLPEALFIENDTMAIGVIKALKENHIKVPEDLSIISCNDIPTAQYMTPSLTTIRIHTDLMGKMAARMAYDRIHLGRERGIKIFVPNELVIRQSCRSPQ